MCYAWYAWEDSEGSGGFTLSERDWSKRVSSLLPIVRTNRIMQSDDVGLGSSSLLLRARASEYSYILIAACFVFAQLVSSQQCGRGMR
jgi:hypothetical protein